MFKQLLTDPETINMYSQKSFAPAMHSYLTWMEEKGYAKETMRKHLFLLASFSDYLTSQGINTIEEIPACVFSFVANRVQESQRKDRTKDPAKLTKELNCYLKQFIRFLKATPEGGDFPAPGRNLDAFFKKVLTDFMAFCRRDRGLAEPTINLYSLYVSRFLLHAQTAGFFLSSQWNFEIVYDYLKKEGATTDRRGMHCVCSSLRNLFRFLRIKGHSLAHGLDKFPRPRIYARESLPRFLQADQVQRTLASVDRTTAQGIRDYAVLMLLTAYGMRAAEVARLSLDDLDWVGGKIHLRNRKACRNDVFPLSIPAGEAIIEYLRNVRPKTPLRQVFLCLHAPIRPIRSGRVSAIARKYLVASGIPLPDRPGAHLFRHTLAHQLLDAGMPYKVIGDFLGHFNASSTIVYLKIDLDGLGQVALNDGEDVL